MSLLAPWSTTQVRGCRNVCVCTCVRVCVGEGGSTVLFVLHVCVRMFVCACACVFCMLVCACVCAACVFVHVCVRERAVCER